MAGTLDCGPVYPPRHPEVSYLDAVGRPHPPRTVPLTAGGRERAAAAVPLDRAVVSGLPRTVETAAIVLAGRGLTPEARPQLREIAFTGALLDRVVLALPSRRAGATCRSAPTAASTARSCSTRSAPVWARSARSSRTRLPQHHRCGVGGEVRAIVRLLDHTPRNEQKPGLELTALEWLFGGYRAAVPPRDWARVRRFASQAWR
jgi:broad specificity phosphatase PhoE